MSSVEVDQPILCSPFAEPAEHWWIEDGHMPERRAGRRPAGYWYRDPKAPEPEARFKRWPADWYETGRAHARDVLPAGTSCSS